MIKKSTVAKAPAIHSLAVKVRPDEPASRTVARSVLDPTSTAACTLGRINPKLLALDVNAFAAELQDQARAASAGKLDRSEAMLVAHAHTLDSLFHTLTVWALNNGGNAAHFETCMRLALKAQSQARATVETLAEIKNPPVVFARQANIAHGPQQVLNHALPSHAGETEIAQTRLLESENGERLDTRATSATGGANPTLETVGAINGTANV